MKLAKEDFKFAAAHFTLFPDAPAERLHGHNYRVRIELSGPETSAEGLLVPLGEVKARLRALCHSLDEHTLIPEKSPLLRVERDGPSVDVTLGGRHYRLPADEVRLLPLANVTMELLAEYLFEQLAPDLRGGIAETLAVEVEESPGQICRYVATLAGG
ncbi:MAG: 6-carboxytetrahydropterin synthase [Planctomycetota bacterium]|nr:6-carboxytetrahydropterin synthase [Planctomycetota bacterium]